jgi:hypothetical protein
LRGAIGGDGGGEGLEFVEIVAHGILESAVK